MSAATNRVYVVMGYDEDHSWIATPAYVDEAKADAVASSLQADADSSLELYTVQEVEVHA